LGGIGIYIAALVMGLAGSMHCLGMCGPIFMATSSFYGNSKQYILPFIYHHLGKLFSYAVIGLLMGIIGKGASLLWFQNRIMFICGLVLIAMAVGSILKWKGLNGFNSWISRTMGKALKKSGAFAIVVGILNGLVPCGLVYAAAVGALATQSYSGGMLFMFVFGLGTIPALGLAGFSRWLIPFHMFKNLGVWKRIPILILGIWLLLKGLGLGIPYISPDLGSHKPEANCCKKHKVQFK
jgi:uncharacterized protein